MPYVAPEVRQELLYRHPANAGELNYVLTVLIGKFEFDNDELEDLLWYALERYMKSWDRESYANYNDLIGVLRCAQLEHQDRDWVGSWLLERLERRLYRERVRPYEDKKIVENGDVKR